MKEIISSIGKLNHIAIAVPNIQIASDMWKKALGANISAPQILTDHGVKVVFVEAPNTKVELLEPLNKNSPISRFLEKNPNGGMHHICYEVDNINKVLDHANKHNAKLRICEACKVYGSHPHPEGFVAFLDDEVSGTEIEFMQVYTEEELEKHKISGV